MAVGFVQIAISSQEIFKAFLCYHRVKSKKWVNNIVDNI